MGFDACTVDSPESGHFSNIDRLIAMRSRSASALRNFLELLESHRIEYIFLSGKEILVQY
jgi:hypothetical protein